MQPGAGAGAVGSGGVLAGGSELTRARPRPPGRPRGGGGGQGGELSSSSLSSSFYDLSYGVPEFRALPSMPLDGSSPAKGGHGGNRGGLPSFAPLPMSPLEQQQGGGRDYGAHPGGGGGYGAHPGGGGGSPSGGGGVPDFTAKELPQVKNGHAALRTSSCL
jgi:translation initiation factor IF-2